MAERSRDADLTLIGMQLPAVDQIEAYAQRLNEIIEAVGSVLLVRSGETDEDLLHGA